MAPYLWPVGPEAVPNSELVTFLDSKSAHSAHAMYFLPPPAGSGHNLVIKLINISAAKWMDI